MLTHIYRTFFGSDPYMVAGFLIVIATFMLLIFWATSQPRHTIDISIQSQCGYVVHGHDLDDVMHRSWQHERRCAECTALMVQPKSERYVPDQPS